MACAATKARERLIFPASLSSFRCFDRAGDPPYNVAIDGHVCGLGSVRHREFTFASGDMSREAFTAFLTTMLFNASALCRDGAIAFVGMDWWHMREMLDAGDAAFSELKKLCVWNKTNGGMGSFYRSKHELVCVYKAGTAPPTNSFGLGESGRYRTNVWDYPGISSMSSTRADDLATHPTVKPVALITDAIRDCSKRGEIVLDIFVGSDSTLIAAHICGRRARLIEYDPIYCDTIITRWQRLTGKQTELSTGRDEAAGGKLEPPLSFEAVAETRLGSITQATSTDATEPGLRRNTRRPARRTKAA